MHTLPSLYIRFKNPNTKELAMLDSGSECNLIPYTLVKKYGLYVTFTIVTLKGLYKEFSLKGEISAVLYIRGHRVPAYFFMVGDGRLEEVGFYRVLLRFPFFRDTNLGFNYSEGRLVLANIDVGNTIMKCAVVTDELAY
jgi:hypothetical protein